MKQQNSNSKCSKKILSIAYDLMKVYAEDIIYGLQYRAYPICNKIPDKKYFIEKAREEENKNE